MSKVLVIAPHPDDETLGCGGSLFKHKDNDDELYWIIVTSLHTNDGWDKTKIQNRELEIENVNMQYGFKELFNLKIPTTKVDTIPISSFVQTITEIYDRIKPEIIYIPFLYDVHTDHQIISKSLQSSIKWFRHPHIKRVLMYETLSETEFNFSAGRVFRPNVFIDITDYISSKIKTMEIYDGELREFPFPRSTKSIKALATLRGSQSGYEAAEAFELVYERL